MQSSFRIRGLAQARNDAAFEFVTVKAQPKPASQHPSATADRWSIPSRPTSGGSLTNALFHLESLRQTRVFSEWEKGYLLDGLAFGPKPAIAGLDEELRTLDRENLGDRHKAGLRNRLSAAILAKPPGRTQIISWVSSRNFNLARIFG